MSDSPNIPVKIRDFCPADAAVCQTLYVEGLLGGKLAENDAAEDIADINATYMKTPGNHFWVAVADDGSVVGMIGVRHRGEDVGEIRRLRVSIHHRRRGIG